MPILRIHGHNLSDFEENDLDEIELNGGGRRQQADLKTNFDARARSAELIAQRRSDRRKSAMRGPRRNSERR